MKNKKLLLIISGIFTSLISLHALDFGGSLGTYTKLGSPIAAGNDEFKNFSLKQEEILTLWLRQNINPTTFIAFEADARFRSTRRELGKSDSADNDVIIPDLKVLRLTKRIDLKQNTMLFNVGRFFFSDLTGTVLSQPADGLSISLDLRRFYAKAYANYTGLLNAQNVTILNKAGSEYNLDSKKSWQCAASYANFGAQFELPYFIANQTISTEFLASIGFDGIEKGSADYNRIWGTLGLNGFLHKNLCYVLTTTFGSQLDSDLSNLTKLSFMLLPGYKSMVISLSGLYASGDQNGLKPFRGFTSQTAVNSIDEPEYTSLVKGGLSLSIKPVKQLLLAASGNAVFDYPDSEIKYKGTEAGLNANIQLFSDFNINAGISQFFAKEEKASKGTFTLTATLAF